MSKRKKKKKEKDKEKDKATQIIFLVVMFVTVAWVFYVIIW